MINVAYSRRLAFLAKMFWISRSSALLARGRNAAARVPTKHLAAPMVVGRGGEFFSSLQVGNEASRALPFAGDKKKGMFGLVASVLGGATFATAASGGIAFADGHSASAKSELVGLLESVKKIEAAMELERRVNEVSSKVVENVALGAKRSLSAAAMAERVGPPPTKLRMALCQTPVGEDKASNLVTARGAIDRAVRGGAELVALPECFQCPYATSAFPKYAEVIPESTADLNVSQSPSTAMLVEAAMEHGVYLIGGSIPEIDVDGSIYNMSIIVSPYGEILGKHRKMHLFDIDVPGRITFKESDTLSAGNSITTFDMPHGKVGVGICYDIRFPEQSMLMRAEGCKLLVFPGAFNMTTGPAHWELLQKGRALDNQVYVAAVSPARDESASYHAWGHSTCISPWGDVVATTGHEPDIVFCDIDFAKVEEIRTNIPVSMQKRTDLYELRSKK